MRNVIFLLEIVTFFWREVEIVLVKTGVKNMEHAAKDFDVSCLFESNGHGTVGTN
jgi:hypothetical protein